MMSSTGTSTVTAPVVAVVVSRGTLSKVITAAAELKFKFTSRLDGGRLYVCADFLSLAEGDRRERERVRE